MAAHFNLTLDTTAPALEVEINGGSPATEDTLVTLRVVATDALTTTPPPAIRIWGDIDPTDPINENYGETEEDAPPYFYVGENGVPEFFMVRLLPGDGLKRLTVRARDEVLNTSAAISDTITIGEVAAPAPAPGAPKQPPARLRQEIVRKRTVSRVGVRLSYTLRTATESRSGVQVLVPPSLEVEAAIKAHLDVGVETATQVAAYAVPTASRANAVFEEFAVQKRPEGPDAEDELVALGLL